MATILEEFISIFRARADNSELVDFNNETERTGEVTDRQRPRLARFEESLQNVGNTAKGVISKLFNLKNAIVGAIAGIVVDKVTDQAEEMYQLGQAYGMSTEKISEFSQVAGQVGVEFDDVRDAIFQTSKTMGAAFSGVGAGAGFKKDFNLDFLNADKSKKSMAEVFDMYRSKVKGMNKQEQLNFIDEAGINENFLRVFQLGDKEYNKFMAQASKNAITTEQGKQAQEFNRTLKSLTNQVMSLGRAFVFELLPYLEKVMNVISQSIEFFKEHSVVIKAFTALIVASGVAFIGYFKILQGFRSLATFTRYMRMFGNQALLAQAKLFLIPLAIVAIIAGLALLVEDFYNFFNGGDSAIGGLVKKFPELGKVIFKIRDGVMVAFNAIKAIISDAMVTILKIWDKIKPAVIIVLDVLVKYFITSFSIMIDVVSSAIDVIGDVIMGIVDIFSGVFDIVKGIFTGNFDLIKRGFGDLWDGIYSLFFKPLIAGWNLAKKIVGKVASFLGFGGGDDKKDDEKVTDKSIQPTTIAKNIATNKTDKEQSIQSVRTPVVNTDTEKKQLEKTQADNKKKNVSILSMFTNKFTNNQEQGQQKEQEKTPSKVVTQGGIIDTLNKKLKINNTQEKTIVNNEKEINTTTAKEKEVNNNLHDRISTVNNNQETNNNTTSKDKEVNNNSITDHLVELNKEKETKNNQISNNLKETNNVATNKELTEKTNTINNLKEKNSIEKNNNVLETVNNNHSEKEINNNNNTNTLSSTIERNHERTINNNNTLATQPQEIVKGDKSSNKPSKIDSLTSFLKKRLDFSNSQPTQNNATASLGVLQPQPIILHAPQSTNIPLGNVHNIVNNNQNTTNNNNSKTGGSANSNVEVKAVNINLNSGSSKEIASNIGTALTNQLKSVHMARQGTAKA